MADASIDTISGLCGFRESVMPSGLSVLTDYLPPEIIRPQSVVFIYFWAGNWHDLRNMYGLAHITEHKALERSSAFMTREELFRQRDALGAYFNAETRELSTRYLAKVLDPNLFPTLELLLKQALFPKLDRDELETEKGVIQEEIRRYKANPEVYPELRAKGIVFGVEPFSLYGLGSVEGVANITREDILDFRTRYYTPDNATVVVISPYDYGHGPLEARADRFHDDIVRIVSQYFDRLPKFNGHRPGPRTHRIEIDGPTFAHDDIGYDNVYLARATQNGAAYGNVNDLGTWLLSIILNNRFNDQAREIGGMAYEAKCEFTRYPENFLLIKTSCHPLNLPRVERLIEQMQGDLSLYVPEQEFLLQQEVLRSTVQRKYRLGTSGIRAHLDQRLGIGSAYAEQMAQINALTPYDVVAGAQHLFAKPYAHFTLGKRQ